MYIVSIILCIAMKETHSQGVPCVLQLPTFPFPQASETANGTEVSSYDRVNKRRLSLLKNLLYTFLVVKLTMYQTCILPTF